MRAHALMPTGYLDTTKSTGTPREVEYQLFSRVTGRMNQANRDTASFPELIEAVDENLTLWRTIALEVADEDNALPQKLRAQLFYLYEFTSAHTRKVLKREADATALIDVNMSIMRGLKPM